MKTLNCTMVTTHVDLAGERFAVEGLEPFAASVNNNYLPFTREHDIRKPPIGRVASATVVQLEDGEFAVTGTVEVFEESDTLSSVRGDGRRIQVARDDIPTFRVEYDSSYETPEGRELLAALNRLSPESGTTVQIKKSVEPISTLTIAMYIGGAIAAGALAKLGEDLYLGLKDVLKGFFGSPTLLEERLLDFQFTTLWQGRPVEAHVLLTNPNPKELEALFGSGFADLDAFLSRCQGENLARFVFEYRNGQLRCLYILRGDCVPLQIRHIGRVMRGGPNDSDTRGL